MIKSHLFIVFNIIRILFYYFSLRRRTRKSKCKSLFQLDYVDEKYRFIIKIALCCGCYCFSLIYICDKLKGEKRKKTRKKANTMLTDHQNEY